MDPKKVFFVLLFIVRSRCGSESVCCCFWHAWQIVYL